MIAPIGGMAIVSAAWTPHDPLGIALRLRLSSPNQIYWFGTDEFGRDVLSRVMAGAATSLLVASLTVVTALALGVLIGVISGYLRGTTDRVLMVVNDALLAFPNILFALGVMAVVGTSEPCIILALGLAYAPSVARVVRGAAMSQREREYVEASRAIGNSELFTMVRHVLPNCVVPIVVVATSVFGWVVLVEGALSFLGLGIRPPAPSWGNMLASGRPYMETAPWLGVAPGLCILLTLLGVNLLGDALRDRLDPRTPQSKS